MLLAAGCSGSGQSAALLFDVSGRLEDATITEASGLARSYREPGVLWIINDNGAKEIVHATNQRGAELGEFRLDDSSNKDWEDLASFLHDGAPMLMVADIGDNNAKRKHRTLYFVPEPAAADDDASTRWRVRFRYPDGPRDAEAAAIDVERQVVLVLSKRDLPPRLYEVPLTAAAQTIDAMYVGPLQSLPVPSQQDVAVAPRTKDWWWQPVGMDIAADNQAAVILTYRSAFYFERSGDQSWYEALQQQPLEISLGNFENAEAVAFADMSRTVVVTGENRHARLLRADLNKAPAP